VNEAVRPETIVQLPRLCEEAGVPPWDPSADFADAPPGHADAAPLASTNAITAAIFR
jgi:hypothetical protein